MSQPLLKRTPKLLYNQPHADLVLCNEAKLVVLNDGCVAGDAL
jgi:hypothetical protein